MANLLAIDYGTKRIGLALGDDELRMATPLPTVSGAGDPITDIQSVRKLLESYEIDTIVVGLPLNMDGSEGPQAKLTRLFGDGLGAATGYVVWYVDERLSSMAAEEAFVDSHLSRGKKKPRVDGMAAVQIMETYWESGAIGRAGADDCGS